MPALPSGSEPGGRGGLPPSLAVGLLLVGVAATFANTLSNGFVYDDRVSVLSNTFIRSIRNVPEMFVRDGWHGTGRLSQNYRPVSTVGWALDYALFGLDPRGWHATNVAVHLAAVAMAFVVASRVLGSTWAAVMAAGIFGVHPLQTEAVNVVTWRWDVVVAFFTLAGLVAYDGYSRSGRRPSLAAAWACFALALSSKESGMAMPGVMLAWEWTIRCDGSTGRLAGRLWGGVRAAYLGYAAIAAVYLVARRLVMGSLLHRSIDFLDNPLAFQPLLQQKALALGLLPRWGRLLVWPAAQSADYSYHVLPLDLGWTSGWVLGGFLIMAAGLVVVAHRRRVPAAAFGVMFAFITYAMVSSLFFPIQTMMAERWMTVPLFGIALATASGWEAAFPEADRLRRRTGIALGLLVLAACAARTVVRNRDWRDTLTVTEAAFRVVPASAIVNYNLGHLYDEAGGRLPEAEAAYARAIAIWPAYHEALSDRALVLSDLGRHAEAVVSARRAVTVRPDDALSWNNLGVVLYRAGREADAIRAWRRALALSPGFAAARNNLAECRRAARD
ncbi:MAG: tetratricopeptide repeat protein [Candidatus Coatesbacteria bacterium]